MRALAWSIATLTFLIALPSIAEACNGTACHDEYGAAPCPTDAGSLATFDVSSDSGPNDARAEHASEAGEAGSPY